MKVSVGYEGSEGSFSNKAARTYFNDAPSQCSVEFTSVSSCNAIFQRVASGDLNYGVLPVESSGHGTMPLHLEPLLKNSDEVHIVGEIIDGEPHCLCALPGTTETSISRISSHPIILQDCSEFIAALSAKSGKVIEQVYANDSAAACKQLCSEGAGNSAVICTREASNIYNLNVLSPSIGNDRNAETRYIIIANKNGGDVLQIAPDSVKPQTQGVDPPSQKMKGSLSLSIRNSPGGLFRVMSCFSLRDINVLKIESRPSSAALGLRHHGHSHDSPTHPLSFKHWDMIFFIDYEVSEDEHTDSCFWANLKEYCEWVRPLGVYRQHGEPGAEPTMTDRAAWDNMLDIVSTTA